jgi:hypothetical protein
LARLTARDCTCVEEIMKRLCLGIIVAISSSLPAFGQGVGGTAEEARAMLAKAPPDRSTMWLDYASSRLGRGRDLGALFSKDAYRV